MESSTTSQPASVSGTFHYIPPISAFEPTTKLVRSANVNTLLWIGGLFDTYHSTQYPYALAQQLPPTWSLAQVFLSSAGHGWGTASLGQDVQELEKVVKFFREKRPGGKIAVMGHSTGCQDGIHYVVSPAEGAEGRAPIDGLILQASVSDREAIQQGTPKEQLDRLNELALSWIADGRGDDCLPFGSTSELLGKCPVSARRWISLASPDKKGEDDYFSSDLTEETLRGTFGKIPKSTPLLLLYGEKDECVKPEIDKAALLRKWVKIVQEGGGAVDPVSADTVPGATHNLNGVPESVVDELCKRVVSFVTRLESKEFET